MSNDIEPNEVLAFVLDTMACGNSLNAEELDAFIDKHRPLGRDGVGDTWLEHSEKIATLYGALEPARVCDMAFFEFFDVLDQDDGRSANSFKYALHLIMASRGALIAVPLAHAYIDAYLTDLVSRDNAYAADFDIYFDAFSEQFFGSDNNLGIMVIEKQTTAKHVNRFLREVDPRQSVKLIVSRRGEFEWQIYTVNYKCQPFNTYVPISKGYLPGVNFVHRKQFYAIAMSKTAALELARQSMVEYRAWGNLPNRMLRWWHE